MKPAKKNTGSAFYGYHIETSGGPGGRAVVVRNVDNRYSGTGNYYKTAKAAQAQARKHNKLIARTKKNAGRKPSRKNPLDTAKTIYRKFHGRAHNEVLDIIEPMHVHKHLSGIGDLVGLQILQQNGRAKVTLKFDAGTVLAQNEKRNQLFIRGGDQSVNLKDFGITAPHHELENLGEVIWVSYYTRKDHLAPEDGGEAVYKHRFGRKKPTLIYDTVNKKMDLAGGGYDIPDEGIDR
jgi:hypothetical protein